MKPQSVSLVITTYNRPAVLSVVLHSALKQSRLPDEIIVADDGSDAPTTRLIALYAEHHPEVPILHSRQEDLGYRMSAARNKAIALARSEYVVLIDGDMILHQDYLKHHLQAARAGTMYISSRTLLSVEASCRIAQNGWFPITRYDIVKNKHHRLIIPHLWRLLPRIKSYARAKGYMGFWRADCVVVNGFDERFDGAWGREDSDFMMRMIHSGITARRLKYSAVAHHVSHPLAWCEKTADNHQLLLETIRQRKIRCERGIDQYL